jgi:hypothetical protein
LVVPDLDLKSELSKEFGLGDREERQENIAISRERTKRFSSLSGNWTRASALRGLYPNHWTNRELHGFLKKIK